MPIYLSVTYMLPCVFLVIISCHVFLANYLFSCVQAPVIQMNSISESLDAVFGCPPGFAFYICYHGGLGQTFATSLG